MHHPLEPRGVYNYIISIKIIYIDDFIVLYNNFLRKCVENSPLLVESYLLPVPN